MNVFVVSIPKRLKGINTKESVICEFEMDFKKSFCWRSNLSNICIIFVQVIRMLRFVTCTPGLKTGVENDIFWSEMWSGFGVEGGTPPPRILWRTPQAVILVYGVVKCHEKTGWPGCSRIRIQRTEVSCPVFKLLYSQLIF